MSESDNTNIRRLIDLGVLKFIKKSEDYNNVIYKAKTVLLLIYYYNNALSDMDDLYKKKILNDLLSECDNKADNREVAIFLIEKLIGKDYIGLYNMKQHGQI